MRKAGKAAYHTIVWCNKDMADEAYKVMRDFIPMKTESYLSKDNLNCYTTHQIAEYAGVCVNTVRNYEKYGFISKSIRKENGYRIFTDIHKLQMKICRLIFTPPYVNKVVRKASIEVIRASAQEDFLLCKEKTLIYIKIIENELKKTNDAIKILADFNKPKNQELYYDRKEAATLLGTTVETIRNWERNGLIIASTRDKKSVYNQNELDIMYLIYTLLMDGFTIQKIYESLSFLRKDNVKRAVETLYEADSYKDILSVQDNIIIRLNEVLESAYAIKEILDENI